MLDTESTTIGTNMSGKVVTDLPLSIYNGGRFVEDFAVASDPRLLADQQSLRCGCEWLPVVYQGLHRGRYNGDRFPFAATPWKPGPAWKQCRNCRLRPADWMLPPAITNGGVMAFTLKSGTNQFHGTLFGYGHNGFLDANTWNNDFYGKPKAEARAWDYGASFGGPIFKNKLFFFGTFERYTQTDFTLGGPSSFVPTSAMLNGDFSALLDTSSVLGIDRGREYHLQGAVPYFSIPRRTTFFPGNIISNNWLQQMSHKRLIKLTNRITLQSSPACSLIISYLKATLRARHPTRRSRSWTTTSPRITLSLGSSVCQQPAENACR